MQKTKKKIEYQSNIFYLFFMQNYFEKYDINLEQNEILLFEKFLQIFKLKNSQINLSAIRDDE